MIDFYRPDGTPVAVVRGDPRQLNDATFHAGTELGQRVRVRRHVQLAPLLRAADIPEPAGRALLRRGRPPNDGRPVHSRRRSPPPQERRSARNSRDVHVPPDEYRAGGDGHLRPGRLPALGELQQPGLEGHPAERAGLRDAGPDRADPRARLRDPLTDEGDARTTVTLEASPRVTRRTATRTCNGTCATRRRRTASDGRESRAGGLEPSALRSCDPVRRP